MFTETSKPTSPRESNVTGESVISTAARIKMFTQKLPSKTRETNMAVVIIFQKISINFQFLTYGDQKYV
jgi:hypothetical protein